MSLAFSSGKLPCCLTHRYSGRYTEYHLVYFKASLVVFLPWCGGRQLAQVRY